MKLLTGLGLLITTEELWDHLTTIDLKEIDHLWNSKVELDETSVCFNHSSKFSPTNTYVTVSLFANIGVYYPEILEDLNEEFEVVNVELWHQDGMTHMAIESSDIDVILIVFEHLGFNPKVWKVTA